MTPSYNVLCCFDYCNTLIFPSSVYNTILCVMYKLIQPTISFKIQNQDILEILLKVSLKHHKPKPNKFCKVSLDSELIKHHNTPTPHSHSILHYRIKKILWIVAGQLFFPGTLVSSNNKTDRLDLTEIVLKWRYTPCTFYPITDEHDH